MKRIPELVQKFVESGFTTQQALRIADKIVNKYDPDQPRDDLGRFGSGGGIPASSSGHVTDGQTGDPIVVPGNPERDNPDNQPASAGDRISEGGPTSAPPNYDEEDKPTPDPYERSPKPIAPEKIPEAYRTNFSKVDGLKNDPALTQTKGKDLTKAETARFNRLASTEMVQSVVPSIDRLKATLKAEKIDIISSKIRAKDPESLVEKMNGKWSDKTLDQVTDGIGARLVFRNQKELDSALAKMPRALDMKIVEQNDFAAKPQASGYRAVHLLATTKSGMIAEVQLKTKNQDTWSKWSHDQVYKNPDMKNNAEVNKYGKAVSEYLSKVDNRQPAGEFPKAPESVVKAGLEFPKDKILTDPYAKS